MKVVLLSTSGELGGAEVALLEICRGLRASQPDRELRLIVPAPGRLAAAAAGERVATTVLPWPPALARFGESASERGGPAAAAARVLRAGRAAAALPGYLTRLRRDLVSERASVVHTHGFKAHVAAALAAPPGAPVIWHMHEYIGSRPLTGRLLRLCARRVAAVVANSDSVAADVRRVLGKTPPVRRIYNAVDLARFAPEGPAADLDAQAGLPPAPAGAVKIGLVATFARWKGQEAFLTALARLPPALPWRGYVVGGPIYQTYGSQYTFDELRGWAARLGVGARVGFTGILTDVASAMRALDIVVHASTRPEPFGMVVAEAMACGRALVASRAGGAAELIREGIDALGHPPGDVAGLASALCRLVGDAGLRAHLGTAARGTASQRFDRARLAREMAAVYDAVGGAAAGPHPVAV